MKDITHLYDGERCRGFVKRPDGYWWIRDGELTSMSDERGKELERLYESAFFSSHTPYFYQTMKYMFVRWRFSIAAWLFGMAKRVERFVSSR